MGLLNVTIDIDEIYCYHAIHGLEPPTGDAANAIEKRALPRAARFLEELGIPGTFFAVGKDLERGGEAASLLRDLVRRGHEVGNHSMSHRYDLTMLPTREQEAEVQRAHEAISRATGVVPRGFRAPGYNMNLGIVEMLKARGYLYDSSVFPCPLYYSAKAFAIGMKSLKGKRSASLAGDPRVLTAPTGPYRIGEDGLWIKGDGLRELPITVVTRARLPLLGTFITMMGAVPSRLLARAAKGLPFVNIELHPIDFADADGDGLGYLKEHQPDLRVPMLKRRAIFERLVKTLLDSGLEPTTLSDAASRFFI